VCDLETSRMGAPYIYDVSHLRVKEMYVFAWLVEECIVFETPGISFMLVRCFSLSHSPVQDIDTCFFTSKVCVLFMFRNALL